MLKRKYLVLFLIQLISYCAYAQPTISKTTTPPTTSVKDRPEDDKRGLKFGLGYSAGYSSHAKSYVVTFLSVNDYSGFRIIVLDARLGWRFHQKIGVYGTWRFSPSNATISPYRSLYRGGYVAFYPTPSTNLSLHGGVGKYESKVSKEETAGDGLLVNIGMAVEIRDHFLFEINILTGSMDAGNVDPNPFIDREFNFTMGFAYVF